LDNHPTAGYTGTNNNTTTEGDTMPYSTIAIDHAAVKILTDLLPGDWTYSSEYDTSATLTRSDDLTLSFWVDHGSKKTSVRLAGIPQNQVRYNEKRPSINVTLDWDSAPRVARDIERRLLPAAEAFKAIIDGRVEATNQYENERETLASILSLAVDDTGKARINEGAVWGDVTVYANDATMSLHNLSPTQALAILRIVRGKA
jgi:hypothetical protein